MERGDAIDEGWDDDAPRAEAPARVLFDPPPRAAAEIARSGDAKANEAEKVDTAKSRLVRLGDKPVRSDPLEEPQPQNMPEMRTVPPPADYDVVRQTAKHKAFDLDAALERAAAAERLGNTARGDGPAAPPADVTAPLPQALEPRSERVTKSAFARDDEHSAPARPRRRLGWVVAGAAVCVAATFAGIFALAKRTGSEDVRVSTRASAAQESSPPSRAASAATASIVAPTTAATTDAPSSRPLVATPAPLSPPSTARPARVDAPRANAATSAPAATAAAPAPSSRAPAASTPAVKGAPGVEFLKRNL